MSFLDLFRGKPAPISPEITEKPAAPYASAVKVPLVDTNEVKALRDVTVLQMPDGFTPTQQFTQDARNPLAQALIASAYAYSCMTANALAKASLPPMIQRRGTKPHEGKWVEDREHELNRVLEEPLGAGAPSNPRPRWAWDSLLSSNSMQKDLVGSAYLRPITYGPHLRGFEPMLPNRVRMEISTRGYVSRYFYNDGLREVPLAPDEVVHLTHMNPGSTAAGLAPFESAISAVVADQTIIKRIQYNLLNKVAPGLIFVVEGGMTKTQKEDFLDMLFDQYEGATKDGVPLVLGGATGVQVVPTQNQQTDYATQERAAKDRILAVFRTPPPMIGDWQAATLQNFDRAISAWWVNTLLPSLKSDLNSINQQIIRPLYGPDYRIWYDIADTEIGLILLDEKIKAAKGLTELGYPTNMAARHVGLEMEYVPELDTPNSQLALAGRGGSANPGADDPNDENHTPGREPAPNEVSRSDQRPG